MKKYILLLFLSIAFNQSYTLQDINSNSDYYGSYIGPEMFTGQVTLHYFGHQN